MNITNSSLDSTPSVLARLYRLAPRGAELGLDRMRAACERFGHPEREFRAVHVAGTNGKGSVCAMVAAMGAAAGKLVGLYTSPHLCRFAERIQVDGHAVDDVLLLAALEEVLDGAPELTFFEAATLTAFLAFARLEVELAVIEVGLGGRLDATNVLCSPRVTAITRIALDHTDRLGSDIASIAREKAGIIKPDVPLVVGPLEPEAMMEIRSIARTMQAPMTLATGDPELLALVQAHPPALLGAHQIDNGLIAASIAQTLDFRLDAIRSGLANVRWPGRLELIATKDGDVLLDAAHNPDGVRSLVNWLETSGRTSDQIALVFGAMFDKDYASMLCLLAPVAAHRVYVTPEGRKPADPAVLARLAFGTCASTHSEALRSARERVGSQGLVVVAGSIYLIGAVRAELLGLRKDPPVAL